MNRLVLTTPYLAGDCQDVGPFNEVLSTHSLCVFLEFPLHGTPIADKLRVGCVNFVLMTPRWRMQGCGINTRDECFENMYSMKLLNKNIGDN